MKVVLATANPGKQREFAALLGRARLRAGAAVASSASPAIEETGTDLRGERAAQGAPRRRAVRTCRRWRTTRGSRSTRSGAGRACSRRASPGPTPRDEENNAALIAALANVPPEQRTARYRCVLALVRNANDPRPLIGAGHLGGAHRARARGQPAASATTPSSFPAGLECTAAELSPALKNALSHRGAALRELIVRLGYMHLTARRRSRCTCISPGACASARTATSTRTRSTASCRSRPTSRRCWPMSTPSAARRSRERAPVVQPVPRRRHAEPVRARARIGELLDGAPRARSPSTRDAEITLEANPGTIERGRFADYRAAGITRVSLGRAELRAGACSSAWGASTRRDETRTAAQELHAAGLEQLQSRPDVRAARAGSRRRARRRARRDRARAGAHLALPADARAGHGVRRPAARRLPDDDSPSRCSSQCQAELAAAGYAQYEISAYARAGAQCAHNLNYWRFGDYLGVGAGAHGKLTRRAAGRSASHRAPHTRTARARAAPLPRARPSRRAGARRP